MTVTTADGVVALGHSGYYPRFGFVPAHAAWQLTMSDVRRDGCWIAHRVSAGISYARPA